MASGFMLLLVLTLIQVIPFLNIKFARTIVIEAVKYKSSWQQPHILVLVKSCVIGKYGDLGGGGNDSMK